MADTGAPFNLPYPLLTETPNGPAQIEALADATHAHLGRMWPCLSTQRPPGVPGRVIFETDTGRSMVYINSFLGWQPDAWNKEWGVVGFVRKTTEFNFTPPGGGGVTVPGLTLAVTTVKNRRYRLSHQGGLYNTVASTTWAAQAGIYEGAVSVGAFWAAGMHNSTGQYGDTAFGSAEVVIDSPNPGIHNYEVRAVGAHAGRFLGYPTHPAHLLVEDIGPATINAPTS